MILIKMRFIRFDNEMLKYEQELNEFDLAMFDIAAGLS